MIFTKRPDCMCHERHGNLWRCECECHKGIGLFGGYGGTFGSDGEPVPGLGWLCLCSIHGCPDPAWNPPLYPWCVFHYKVLRSGDPLGPLKTTAEGGGS